MGLSASQGRMLLLTARRSDLEFRAQQISQKRLVLSQQLEQISQEYEDATSNRIMNIGMYYVDDDGKKVNRTSNLTYAALMSATYGIGAANSGIRAPLGYIKGEYESVRPYRLVNADGAIVVSSVDEIMAQAPTGYYGNLDDRDSELYMLGGAGVPNLYEQKDVYVDNEMGIETPQNQQLVYNINGEATNPDIKVKLAEFMDKADRKIEFDPSTGIACVTYSETEGDNKKTVTRYFDMNSQTGGELTTDAEGKYSDEDQAKINQYKESKSRRIITLVNQTEPIKDKCYEVLYSQADLKQFKGADGVYNLPNGMKYVVDPGLADSESDTVGSNVGPNYLQDCLRNGKYLLQQGGLGTDANGNYRWASVSWDATSNISDNYYTEDDDAAKAKYDRLQTQIQNQDKKLELELDQIETQRQAVTTEIESIEKVINENIESTFNAFNA